MDELLGFLESFWPALAAATATAAFPFVTKIREHIAHYRDNANRANSLAGIMAAGVLLYIYLERNSLHIIDDNLPPWWVAVGVGIILLISNSSILGHRAKIENPAIVQNYSPIINFVTLFLFCAGYICLTYGFNFALANNVIYTKLYGNIDQKCGYVARITLLNDEGSSIATSRYDENRYYQFLIKKEVLQDGIRIKLDKREAEVVLIPQPLSGNLSVDPDC